MNASNPVSARTSIGNVKLKMGSTIAILGNNDSPLIPDLKFFFISVIIDPFETSDPVPDVVGIATIGKCFFEGLIVLPIIFSILFRLIPTAIALAASMALPPPSPIIKSIFFF